MSAPSWQVIEGDARAVLATLPAASVHTCVTSPPYFGLRSYLPAEHPDKAQEVGLEESPEVYVTRLVGIFREVKRVLHDRGTLWVNIADSYATQPGKGSNVPQTKWPVHDYPESAAHRSRSFEGVKPKDLLGIPWMLAFALRADGWWLRSEISLCKVAPMPESVRDRPTSATEKLFLLAKRPDYFYDQEAVRVPHADKPHKRGRMHNSQARDATLYGAGARWATKPNGEEYPTFHNPAGRNAWNWMPWTPEAFNGCHFATFPTFLPKFCIRAGSSERGCCPACLAPWVRVVEKSRTFESGSGRAGNLPVGKNGAKLQGGGATLDIRRGPCVSCETVGWEPSCRCAVDETRPCTVLDCFAGAGTTGLVAVREGRNFVGVELNREYAEMARKRVATAAAQGRLELV